MRIAYFDCIAGASGDMILGALLDAGLPEAKLRQALLALDLTGFELNSYPVQKNGLHATKADILVEDETNSRTLAQILDLLAASRLPEAIRTQAVTICSRLGEVEASIHNLPIASVHLHELGGLDTIVDIVGALIGLSLLRIERVYASPLPMGRGFTHSAHGLLPLPAPATLALLAGVPIQGSELESELVTPTGAAILSSLVSRFGPIPPMTLLSTGYGAGGRDLPIPNVLRLLVGDLAEPALAAVNETLALLETNLDDLNPQVYEYLMERLFQEGALDVFLQPIQMKKNRPATLVSVLCPLPAADRLSAILFSETSTLGVRKQPVERQSLRRVIRALETSYGSVRVKFALLVNGQVKFAPEYEDCRELAARHAVPLREVSRAAERLAQKIAADMTATDFPGVSQESISRLASLDSLNPGE
jgi:pyridinium-3,5-bisthiocarboxylic acid mononucleotide nickel chelatase